LGSFKSGSQSDPKKNRSQTPTFLQVRQLGRSPLFNRLPEEELEHLASRLRIVEMPPGAVLFEEGDAGSHFYVVIYGELEIIKALGTVDERLLALRGPGDFVGELSLMNPSGRRTASVRSRGPAKLWEITHHDVNELLTRQPLVAYDMMQMISDRLTEAHDAIFRELSERNRQLTQAYEDLVQAQDQIVEKERLDRELQLAYQIQMSILPERLPEAQGVDFGAQISPARAVGGDFYDVFFLPGDKIGVVIGDVADKGVPSAIYMARTHAFLISEAGHCSHPAEALRRVNQHLLRSEKPSLFATVLFGLVDLKTSTFSYARAGHELPLVIAPDGEPYLADHEQGQLLGFFEDPQFDEQVIPLSPGGTVLLYTDGVTDGRSSIGQDFGYERLLKEMKELRNKPAQYICDRLLERLKEFRGNALQDDDVTIVTIRSKK
jgi:phosphoserine phosphatase RsbU/P